MVGKAVESLVAAQPVPGWRWVFVGSKDGDLTSAGAVARLFDEVKPTHVLHLAAAVAGLFANMVRGWEGEGAGAWAGGVPITRCGRAPLALFFTPPPPL
jgi:hypothetical protein